MRATPNHTVHLELLPNECCLAAEEADDAQLPRLHSMVCGAAAAATAATAAYSVRVVRLQQRQHQLHHQLRLSAVDAAAAPAITATAAALGAATHDVAQHERRQPWHERWALCGTHAVHQPATIAVLVAQ